MALCTSRAAHAFGADWIRESPVETLATPFFSHLHGAAFSTTCSLCSLQVNKVQVGGYVWEPRYVVLTVNLFDYREGRNLPHWDELSAQSYGMARAELLWKQGHIGLGTHGIHFGKDINLGLSNQFRWDVYATAMVVRTPKIRLDFQAGYGQEKADVNIYQSFSANTIQPAVWLQGNSKWVGGTLYAKVGIPEDFDGAHVSAEVRAQVRLRLATLGPAQLGLRLDASYQYEPRFGALSLPAHLVDITGGIEFRLHDFFPKSLYP